MRLLALQGLVNGKNEPKPTIEELKILLPTLNKTTIDDENAAPLDADDISLDSELEAFRKEKRTKK